MRYTILLSQYNKVLKKNISPWMDLVHVNHVLLYVTAKVENRQFKISIRSLMDVNDVHLTTTAYVMST